MRRAAYDHAEWLASDAVPAARPRIADMDYWTLTEWERIWNTSGAGRRAKWDWFDLVERFSRDPAVFKPALWSGNVLCGLMLGRPSHQRASGERSSISLHFLEGNPDPGHPLKGFVAPILFGAAETYCRNLGGSSIRLVQPLAGVIPLYVRLGFGVVRLPSGVVYCEKEVSS